MKRTLSSDSIAKTATVSSDTDATVVDTAATPPRSAVPLPQVNTVGPADHPLLGVGTAAPIGAVESHSLPVIAVRAAASNESPDSRLALFESEAFKSNMARVDSADPVAQKYIVDLYNGNEDVQQSDRPADNWVHKAAAQGHAGAQRLLAALYFYGLGVKQDDGKAFYWTQQAAEQGHAGAQSWLGRLYFRGLGVKQDEGKAFYWIQQAAEQGHAVAQAGLGELYFEGRGCKQDGGKAFYWFQQAAEQGLAFAQAGLGGLYLLGRGCKKDDGKTFYWYQQAAEQGHAGAQTNLGSLYLNGRGVEKNERQAAYWKMNAALSADGLTLSCANNLPVELVKFLPQLFTDMPEWHRVRTLDLSDNAINDDAAVNLARLISENQTLEVLNLRSNPIGQIGAAALAQALRFNQTLKELHLDLTDASQLARDDIAHALDSNKNIAVLMKEVKDNPPKASAALPLELIALVEQATIVAHQKAGDANHTQEQTRELLNEMGLVFANKVITDPH